MIDEIFDRQYQAGRDQLHAGVDRLVHRAGRALADTFEAMKRVQFDALGGQKARRLRLRIGKGRTKPLD